MSVWVDIKFAPKDGTFVDLWGDDCYPFKKPRRWTNCLWLAPPGMPHAWYHDDGNNMFTSVCATHYKLLELDPLAELDYTDQRNLG